MSIQRYDFVNGVGDSSDGSRLETPFGRYVLHIDYTAHTDTMREALQHIAVGHDAVCTDCGWMGPVDQTMGQEDVQIPAYKCPSCVRGHLEFGADEIADYALRQIEGGGE